MAQLKAHFNRYMVAAAVVVALRQVITKIYYIIKMHLQLLIHRPHQLYIISNSSNNNITQVASLSSIDNN